MQSAPLRILIVEDSPDDAELIALALAREGIRCTTSRVDRPAEFAASLEADPPDLILCDFHLPRFSPAGVLEMLSDRNLSIPVIIVSRHIAPQEIREMLSLGARACVMKNRLGQLASTIESVLSSRG
jgi:CheY-like chemotaxis protein